MIDQTDKRQLIDFVKGNKERFNIAYDIWDSFKYDICKEIVLDFIDEIIRETIIYLKGWTFKNNIKSNYNKWEGVIFYKPNWEVNVEEYGKSGVISIYLDFNYFRYYDAAVTDAYYGIVQCTDKLSFTELSELIKLIKNDFGEGLTSPWCPWYKFFDDSHKSWHSKAFLANLFDTVEREEYRNYYVNILVSLSKFIEKKADKIISTIKNNILIEK